MNFLELHVLDLTGRARPAEGEQRAMHAWRQARRIDNPAADEDAPMAGIGGHEWFRLPEPVSICGQSTDLMVGSIIGVYFVFAGRHAALFAQGLDLQYDADNKIDRPSGLDSLLEAYEVDAGGGLSRLDEGDLSPIAPAGGLPRHHDDVYFRVSDLSGSGIIETRTTIAYESSAFAGFTLLGTTYPGFGSQPESAEMRRQFTATAADWAVRKECAAQLMSERCAAWPHAPRQSIVDLPSYPREVAYIEALARAYELRRDKGYRFNTDDPYWVYAASDARFREFSLKYTAGLPFEDLGRVLELAVAAHEKARVALTRDYGEHELSALNFEDVQEYARCMQLLGASYLLGRGDLVARIAAMQDHEYRGEDALFEALLKFSLPDRDDDIDEWYHDIPYTHLVDCLDEEAPGRADCIKQFLQAWHPELVSYTWYNGHLRSNGLGGYSGLWAFEAAALAYLLDIDDAGIQHWAYPRELLAYARRQFPRSP
ncbi:PoNe immunity protein domain-containing protein [Janthinobacterium fluminis]|uniref:DUF1911 domain-containing protein n=1 Tax=Janthinobacterium fluminis TaxID=2987524 RepID=A0ABT5K278_9BURK|nr:PoNe immunity protein domain-containing protein [Janthinobacterium fluminis]MDC8758503.1 DUF1911 domain-containing protein [Janthinobacterium fluminis]